MIWTESIIMIVPLEVADVLMKEVDFLYKEPFCTDFKYNIDYYSLIEKPWRKK
jgi:hypothetical protein